MTLPTVEGCVHGIVALDRERRRMTVQCSRCHATHEDSVLFAAMFAIFISSHQRHDSRGRWLGGERLCHDCREACGCEWCKRD